MCKSSSLPLMHTKLSNMVSQERQASSAQNIKRDIEEDGNTPIDKVSHISL